MEAQQGRKRIKTNKKPSPRTDPTEDRIGGLPDSLLIHILSLLPTTKDAIRTGTLSKRWLYLWTHLPSLVFNFDRDPDDGLESDSYQDFEGDRDFDSDLLDFANYVDKTLTLHACPNLHKFQLSLRNLRNVELIAPRLSFWLRFATLRQAQDLSLRFVSAGVFFPQFFYNNPWLRKLKTVFCDFAPTGKVEWTSLRVLDIGFSRLSEETLRSILSGSPVLEYFKLYDCSGIDKVDIGSSCSRLKTLVVDNLESSLANRRYTTYLLSGSSIQHLEIYGNGFQKWEVDNMPSLVSVKLHFRIVPPMEEDEVDEYREMCREVVRKLLEKVGHTEQLELGSWCIQVLSTLEVKGVPAPLIDCKFLICKLEINQRSSPGMASLLCSSSNLEKLAIDISWESYECQFDDPYICEYEFEDNYWRSNKIICNCLFSHLKTVEIFCLSYRLYKEGFLFHLIEFLLKNARLLEKMFVHRGSYWRMEDAVTMVEELSSFPRSSPCAVVTVRK